MGNSLRQMKKKGRGKDKNGRKMNPASLKNLRPNPAWTKGVSGNPAGMSITQRQKMLLLEICPYDAEGKTWLEALAENGMRQALTIPAALSNLLDRHEGKITQPIGGDQDNPIFVELLSRLRGHGNGG